VAFNCSRKGTDWSHACQAKSGYTLIKGSPQPTIRPMPAMDNVMVEAPTEAPSALASVHPALLHMCQNTFPQITTMMYGDAPHGGRHHSHSSRWWCAYRWWCDPSPPGLAARCSPLPRWPAPRTLCISQRP
jgi:hypothetical protein